MLIIRGIEVTQAIQYFRADQHLTDPADRGADNSLALVADKPAWVRVYVESDTAGAIPNVTGTLVVNYSIHNTNAGQPAAILNAQAPGIVTADFDPDYVTSRTSSASTLNFVIPSDRMFGPLSLLARVTDGAQTAERAFYIDATLRQSLRLRGIMVGYNGPDPVNSANTLVVAAPDLADLQSTAAWAMRVMPVGQSSVFEVASTLTRTVPLTGTATNGGCAVGWLNLNAAIAAATVADGNHPGFLYYGLIAGAFPNQSNNGGCASGGVSSGFDGGQQALAHEIGHMCGRAHAPCGSVGTSADPNYPAYEPYDAPAARVASIGEFGLDITTGAVPTPTTARDYMSYCGPTWMSIYGHRALVNNQALNPERVGRRRPWWRDYLRYDPWWWLHYKPDPPPYWIDPRDIRELPERMNKVISVIGVLHADDRVEVLSVTRSEVVGVTIVGQPTDMTVVLQGAKGAELASSAIVATSSHGTSCGCETKGGQPLPTLFQAFVPDVAVGSALVIRRGATQLWKRIATKKSVPVSLPRISRSKGDTVDVSWTARIEQSQDAWVRVSANEGKTWRAVATGVTGNRAVIDLRYVPVGKILFDVVVHDGFRSFQSKPVAFDNAALAPVPAILHPHPGRTLIAGETLCLWGSVAGQPGAKRDGLIYKWMLNGKLCGSGLQVFTVVPKRGRHRCELVVQDASGRTLSSTGAEFASIAADDV